MRLINADALKYKNLAEVNGRLTYVLTPEEINNAPTVEPDEIQAMMKDYLVYRCESKRPQGEWISKHLLDNTHIWVCSECGNQNTHGITVEKACWKCGAKMRGCEEE